MGIDDNLMCLTDRKPIRISDNELEEIKSMIKDKNFRILLTSNGINIFNSDIHKVGLDPYDFYEYLKVDSDASHAFYLGIELARAQIAFELGKNYDQDNELEWGVVKTNKKDLQKRPERKITQRKKWFLKQ